MNAVTAPSVRRASVTEAELLELGFTDEQIARLSALKACYPFIEYVETSKQWKRLQFLKWRFEHGDLQRAR